MPHRSPWLIATCAATVLTVCNAANAQPPGRGPGGPPNPEAIFGQLDKNKDGKISKAVKNFRFLDSPFFVFNKIEALGVPERAAFGYRPPAAGRDDEWPLPPVIVPPMMVKDFNFNQVADAV